MPCYDFECDSCDFVFTVTKSMNDSTEPVCPKCHSSEHTKRVWGCLGLGGMTNKVTSSSSCSGCSSKNCSTCG